MAGCDVAIVGGGIVGCVLAAELAGRGASVALFERTTVAAAASGRNSGAVWQPADPVLDALYRESLAAYRALPDALSAEVPAGDPDASFALDAEPAGILTLGRDEAAIEALAASLARSHPHFAPAPVDPAALALLEPGLAGGLAAVRLAIGFPVAPAAATRAFAALARARGVAILEGTAARVVREGGVGAAGVGGAVGVETADGRVPAGAVVVAGGPWTPAIVDPTGTWRPIRPSWGVIVELELPDPPRHVLEEAAIDAATDPAHGADEAAGSVGFSLVTAAGRSSLGSTFLRDEPDPRAFEARLRDGGAAYVPAIAGAPTRGLRACARPLALDGHPLVGAVPGIERLFVAAGHGPWGISTGPASARHVAALVLGEPDPRPGAVRAATDAGRFGAPPT